MVDRLERAQWVVRKPDELDRRAARIVVTEEGVKAWQRAQSSIRASSRELFASIDEDEKYQLLSMLGRLLGKVAESDEIPEFAAASSAVGERYEK
jgi:DNA-binding MarR family transcriptional regulator